MQRPERTRVVITGAGAITPLGLTAAQSWQAMREGRSGIGVWPVMS
jgi:3-oxoacyl-[acyl-carrier-protein] synthase II